MVCPVGVVRDCDPPDEVFLFTDLLIGTGGTTSVFGSAEGIDPFEPLAIERGRCAVTGSLKVAAASFPVLVGVCVSLSLLGLGAIGSSSLSN